MENLLVKYISHNIQKDLIDDTLNKLSILKAESDNLNNLIKNEKISFDSKTIKPFYNFLYAYYKICDSVNKTEFITELEKVSSGNEVEFWKSIINFFDRTKIAEAETAFLKEMNILDFKDLISHTFKTNVLYGSFLTNYKNWSQEQVNIARRTINTFLYSMIQHFNDYTTTIYIMDIKFHFEEEKYKYIWELCEKDKIYLMLKNITETLDDLYYQLELD